MAVDQAMLELVMTVGQPTMRVYRWNPPCISLGYHQSSETIDMEQCKRDGIDVVRRPTGGRAVFHAEEVTYAIVIPEGSGFYSTSIEHVYNRISQGLIEGIRHLGIPAVLQKRSLNLRNHYKTPVSVSCFSAAAKHEVMLDGRKLVGSAQRHMQDAILQHGSILTGNAHLNLPKYLKGLGERDKERMRKMVEGKTATIGDYLGRTVDYDEVVEALKKGMEEQFSVVLEDKGLADEEKQRAELLYGKFSIYSGQRNPLPEEVLDESISSCLS
jgi:lipoate-protein ligase A